MQSDLFRPHAQQFFEAFFHLEHGIAKFLTEVKEKTIEVISPKICGHGVNT